MSAETFFDTNILVYMIDTADAAKQNAAGALVRSSMASEAGCISWQVVQEFLNVATHKLKPGLSASLTQEYFDEFLVPLCTVWPSAPIFLRALDIKSKHKLHFYDSLIVSGALEAGCKTLYSEDLQAGRKFGDLKIVNPFARV